MFKRSKTTETEGKKKLVVVATHSKDNHDLATIPFIMANVALADKMDVVVIVQTEGVWLAKKGACDDIRAPGFPPFKTLIEEFINMGGRMFVCGPCIAVRNISEEDLISCAKVTAGASAMAEIASATSTLTY